MSLKFNVGDFTVHRIIEQETTFLQANDALPTLTPDLVNAGATPQLWQWLERIRARSAVQTALGFSRTGRPEQAFAPGPEHSRWG